MSLQSIGGSSRWGISGPALVGGLFVLACLPLALVIAVTAGDCSAWLAIPVLCQAPLAIPAAIAVAALPLLVALAARRPLASLLALYIILVPIDDALLVGPSLTITKLLGIAVALAAVVTTMQKRAKLSLPNAVFGWAIVMGLMALSLIWGVDPALSIQNFVTIFSAFALLAVTVAAPIDAQDMRIVINATIASGAAVGLIAIFTARHELSTIAGQVGRLYLTFGSATLDPNRFGASLLLPVAMTVGAIARAKGWQRLALMGVLLLPLSAVYLTASRGTTLALIAMAIVAILSSKYRVIQGLGLVALFGLALVIPNEITSRFTE
ncbi:MAG: hypothetical protein JO104_01175, partial [Candidatus Eremiobacteraeota bacterium]|nr:hypothetical protein [Candidatus Eremiobacteraeota bacterium]